MNIKWALLSLVLLSACADKTQTTTASDSATASGKATMQKETPVAESMNKSMETTMEKAMDEASSTAESVQTEMKDKMDDVKETMKNKVAQVEEKAAAKMEDKGDAVKEAVKDLKEEVTNVAEKKAPEATKAPAAQVAADLKEKMPEAEKKKDDIVAYPEKKQTQVIEEVKSTPKPAAGLHDSFDALLRKHVSSSGKVNYAGFKQDKSMLETYTTALSAVNVGSLKRKEALAFWINAYNAFTIKKIVDNYPLKSITDLDGGKPWDAKWIKLDGRTLSLNNIENDIIRPKYNEPRIHFAVNCAAKSCPPLLNKAWTPSNLESNFNKQTKAFVNSSLNEISADKVTISKIFEWYAKDFGDLIPYLNKYASVNISSGAEIAYKEYDWSLNN